MSWRSHRERHRIRPELLGALVVLGLIAFFYLAATKDLPFTGGYRAHLTFASANQIAPNSPVRIAGVDVGKVESVEQGPGQTADVTIGLKDEGLPLHTDATASVRPRTFLEGSFFVDLHPGSPSAPELEDGGTIPVGQTSYPVQLDQILSTLQPTVRENLTGAVRALGTALSDEGPRAINRTIPQLDPLFTKGAVVSEAFTGTAPHDLSEAVASSSRVAQGLGRDPVRLGSLVSSFSIVARALADRQRELGASIAGLDRVLGDAPPTLDAIDAATPEARRFVAALRPLLRRAPGTINPAIPLAAELQKLLSPARRGARSSIQVPGRGLLPSFVSLAAPTVRSLAEASPNAITSFAGLRPATSCLLNNALPTLKSPVDDGPLSTGQPVYRELLYSLTGLASASRDFDGNGFATRYYAGFGSELLSTPFGAPEGRLFALADEPITGSRPRKPTVAPPLRPDAPCDESDPPDLTAATGPGGFAPASGELSFTSPRVSRAGVRQIESLRRSMP